mmetsp:Transcript_55656/g.162736  ORF Transcript_55656/g.162736 Transcript_55656/m.162736 type:complete len:86 (+) Transcript_55656:355-612(+)
MPSALPQAAAQESCPVASPWHGSLREILRTLLMPEAADQKAPAAGTVKRRLEPAHAPKVAPYPQATGRGMPRMTPQGLQKAASEA